MHFQIAVVAVGLTRQQAFDLASLRLLMQRREARFGLRDDRPVALGFAQFDQLDRFGDVALNAVVALNGFFEPVALAQYLLRLGGVVPQLRVFRLGVQLGQAAVGDVPVKDASSAAPTTF